MSEVLEAPGLFDRALRRVTSLWRDMADRVVGAEDMGVEAQMRACLAGRGGEVSARNRAARLAQSYLTLDAGGRQDFLRCLARFDSDDSALEAAMAALGKAETTAARAAAKAKLRRVLETPRVKLLTQFTTIPDGVKFLVDLRAELLRLMDEDPLLQALETDLRGLLASWFDVGFLELRRIDWNSPAALLEKLVDYEAVHRIRTWRDLKNRLDSDRRCYAFFHPRMPAEPLIFVEVALVKGLAESVQRLLDPKAPVLAVTEADTAIFYSINNCQRGLDGISFGNFLIKRVVSLLGTELPNIRQFATLSPIPGFSRWLQGRLAAEGEALPLSEEEIKALREAAPPLTALPAPAEGGAATAPALVETPAQTLARILARRSWLREEAVAKALEPVLLRLCAHYLMAEASPRHPKRARDPVAHFHLSNGARVERLNWRGDTSDKGLKESAGLMVNYLYDPAKIEEYHEAYVGEGKRAAANAIKRLARG
ncbi:malonyl-CoA decarboxylase [Siccirubricoccus sp. KC 17139]|uniref:Malonyl-CoA decarboxylase n=1 Tax=Siccirubricoccus soli TaxID=2899147 RepID=A0ABT1D9R1_9PROT|nr:malonyl-CoA decarboxylase family protein [Siccirubricoccus soli]MCO6418653.1 malonyl-CoA decarboxylase [Siccirubricoccus soli]MCP2684788.1 malonyl-CoA decarboxylase [Siccirubricoccus soli]